MIAGRTDQCFQIVHQGHALAERLLGRLSRGDVRPGAYDLERTAPVVFDHPEGVLDPDVMPVAVAEAVFQCPAPLFHERTHFAEDARSVLGVEAHGPEVFVFQHLPCREAHDAGDVLADESAGVVARLIGVDDRWRDRHEVLQTLARRFQLRGALFNALFEFIVCLA
jgi:hypothetical protein